MKIFVWLCGPPPSRSSLSPSLSHDWHSRRYTLIRRKVHYFPSCSRQDRVVGASVEPRLISLALSVRSRRDGRHRVSSVGAFTKCTQVHRCRRRRRRRLRVRSACLSQIIAGDDIFWLQHARAIDRACVHMRHVRGEKQPGSPGPLDSRARPLVTGPLREPPIIIYDEVTYETKRAEVFLVSRPRGGLAARTRDRSFHNDLCVCVCVCARRTRK